MHARQAVEKCLKAVLAKHRVEVRKTHDLQALLDLLARNNLPTPPAREGIEALGPFTVELRYDVMATEPLDRAQARSAADSVRRWPKR